MVDPVFMLWITFHPDRPDWGQLSFYFEMEGGGGVKSGHVNHSLFSFVVRKENLQARRTKCKETHNRRTTCLQSTCSPHPFLVFIYSWYSCGHGFLGFSKISSPMVMPTFNFYGSVRVQWSVTFSVVLAENLSSVVLSWMPFFFPFKRIQAGEMLIRRRAHSN